MAAEWKEAPSLAFPFQPVGLQRQVKQELGEGMPHLWGPQESQKAPPILRARQGGPTASLWGDSDVPYEGSVAASWWLGKQEAMVCFQDHKGGTRQMKGATCRSLECRDGGEHKLVKEEICPEDALEAQRQRFRAFCYHEAEGPRAVCNQLRELCRQWLQPERNTSEQILELLILEQFLVILPSEMQTWIRGCIPQTSCQAVSLAEDFLLRQQETESWEKQVRTELFPMQPG